MEAMHCLRAAVLMALFTALARLSEAQDAAPVPVGVDAIHAAMEQSRGYNLLATTNGPRFQTEVLLRLAAEAEARDPRRRPLFIGTASGSRPTCGAPASPPDRRPCSSASPDQHGQDTIVDYRRERVLAGAPDVNPPRRALNVCIWWPKGDRAPGLVLLRGHALHAAAQGHQRARDHVSPPRPRRHGRLQRDHRAARPAHHGHPGRALPAHRRGQRGGEPDRGRAGRPADHPRPGAQDLRGRDHGDRPARAGTPTRTSRRTVPTWPPSTRGCGSR